MVIKHPAKFGGRGHCGSGDVAHLICHVTLQDHLIKELQLYEKKLLIVCNHSIRFGCHRHCGSGDIFIYHVTSCNNVFKGFCNFMVGSLS